MSVLQRFARRAAEATEAAAAKCDLCSEALAPEHRHLLESDTRSVVCVCQACSLLFDRPAASLGKYRLIPDRHLYLESFAFTDAEWNSLHVPVGICFITGQAAYYPGPMGPTEALLDPQTWAELTERYPILAGIQPDLEALLVNRARGAGDHFIVPIDVCFSLVGLMRLHWRGLSGGTEVWSQISSFFATLRKRSRIHSVEKTPCPSSTT